MKAKKQENEQEKVFFCNKNGLLEFGHNIFVRHTMKTVQHYHIGIS